MTAVTRITSGFAGQIASNSLVTKKRSTVSEESSAEMAFGIMVAQGDADDGALIIAAKTDLLRGIVMQNHDFAKDQELGDVGLKPLTAFDVLDIGDITVLVEAAVTPGDSVHVRATTNGGFTVMGAFTPTADGAHTIDISKFARWMTSGDATNRPILHIDMTNVALAAPDA